jgi:hypothetical protein
MALDITKDPTAPYKAKNVFDALVEIARCDPGLTTKEFDFSYEVHYQQGSNWRTVASANRLKAVVDDPMLTTIIGLQSDQIIPRPGSNTRIKEEGGLTAPKFSGGPGADIFIDVNDANDTHRLLPDPTYKYWVWEPLPLLLFHELSHVFHTFIAKDAPELADEQLERFEREKQVRADDNAFRAALKLTAEHPTDFVSVKYGAPTIGGLTFPNCAWSVYGNPWEHCKICSIATAALGSPVNRQIATFRAAKRTFERLTLGSVPILAPMLDSYQLFGPRVAREVSTHPQLRSATVHYGVQPAVGLIRSVEGYLETQADTGRAVAAVEAALAGYEAELAGAVTATHLVAAADAAQAASRDLVGQATMAPLDARFNLFAHVVASVRSTGADPNGPAWVLAGIGMFLRAAAEWSTGRPDAAAQLTAAIGAWLATVPLPRDARPTSALRHELEALRERVFPEAANRAVFGQRLLAHWRAAGPSLNDLLEQAQFLERSSACPGS